MGLYSAIHGALEHSQGVYVSNYIQSHVKKYRLELWKMYILSYLLNLLTASTSYNLYILLK